MQDALKRPGRRRASITALPAVVVATALVLGAGVAGNAATPAAEPTDVEPITVGAEGTAAVEPSEDAESVGITLITGDTVYYADNGGEVPAVSVDVSPDSGTRDVEVLYLPDGVYVVPDQVRPLLDADVVDRELFDVKYLAENGYADTETASLPVIVTYQDAPVTLRGGDEAAPLAERADELPSTTADVIGLPSINGAGVQVDKASAEDFWTEVRGGDDDEPRTLDSDGLGGGIDKIWLDRKVTRALDSSRDQIGVRQAWDLGLDGSGVTVAVLDTGYDAGHPDLAGQVGEALSFVPDEEVQDLGGHGTHVASTVAGTGAASDGRYAGVAPGAELAVGKVLNNAGWGLNSWMIAGMEWAADNADVVNMSVGSNFPSDGTDPISIALNTLTEETQTLFVVAAGNMGPGSATLSSPAAADASLAVAAVSGDDVIAPFSSRGPRRGDHALKPEIAAPGYPVVAAWAEGTDPGPGVPMGEHYIAHAGTSMASPHVAGVAAILLQQHPDWDAQQLKDALMSTSHVAANSVYHQGAGRVDVARATGQNLFATGKADFGLFTYPVDAEPQTRTLTYTNTGSEDVTVELALDVDSDGTPADGDALALSADVVEVPAGSQVEVDLVLDPRSGVPGEFTGVVRGTGSDGAEVVTAVAYVVEPPLFELTVEATDRFGGVPTAGRITVHDVRDRDRFNQSIALDSWGRATVRVPEGDYAIHGVVRTADEFRTSEEVRRDLFATTALGVDADRTVTVDAAQATDVEFSVSGENRPVEPMQGTYSIYQFDADGELVGSTYLTHHSDSDVRYGAIPADEPPVGDLMMTSMVTLREPLITARVTGSKENLFSLTPEWTGRFDGTMQLDLVDAGRGTESDFEALDVQGKLVMVDADTRFISEQAELAVQHGAAALLVMPDGPGLVSVHAQSDNELPIVATTHDEGARLRERLATEPVHVELTGVPESSYTYTLREVEDGRIRDDLSYSVKRSELAVIENAFHSEAERLGGDSVTVFDEWEGGAASFVTHVWQPTQRTDYVTAGPQLRQQQVVSTSRGFTSARLTGPVAAYKQRERVRTDWFRAPIHPTGYTTLPCNLCRSEYELRFSPSVIGDADPAHQGSGRMRVARAMYRDGEPVQDARRLLVPEPATYRIEQVAEAEPDEEHLLSTRSHTAWTFRSQAPGALEIADCQSVLATAGPCAALPLIMLGFDVPLDLDNNAQAGRAFTFTVRTDRARGFTGTEAVSGMRVWLSYDDGATWEEAQTTPRADDTEFRVRTKHPALEDTTGFVSVRVEAWDDAGNRTEQTIERAYALR